jgi:hypothetical protein
LPKNQASDPSLDSKVVPSSYSGLRNGEYNDFKNTDHNTLIREQRENDYVQISLIEKPANYHQLDDEKKYPIDIANAEAMVRLWVKSCGNSVDNPIPISNSDDKRTMEAIIIVCKAHELHFRVPLSSLEYITNPPALHQENVAEYKSSHLRRPIKRLNIDPDAINKLKTEIADLTAYCRDQKDSKPPAEQAQYTTLYETKLTKLHQLVTSAEEGKLDVAALNTAINKSKADIEAINNPPEPPPPRRSP